jgi:hypothetical protein
MRTEGDDDDVSRKHAVVLNSGNHVGDNSGGRCTKFVERDAGQSLAKGRMCDRDAPRELTSYTSQIKKLPMPIT